MPDTHNAHVRSEASRRQSPEVKAGDAAALLSTPAFQDAVNDYREQLILALEEFKHDGSAEADDYVLEVWRQIRTLKGVVRNLANVVQGQKLRAVNFQTGND